VQAGKFSSSFTLFPIAGGGMFVRNEILRFSPGAAAFNTGGDATGMGMQFAQQYYQTYSTNKANLVGVYRADSTHSFEGQVVRGPAEIAAKLAIMPSGQIVPKTIDVHPVTAAGDVVLVHVTGEMTFEGESNPLAFAQAFQIVNQPGAGPYVSNEFFRLNYG
jgi:hypothetical protein